MIRSYTSREIYLKVYKCPRKNECWVSLDELKKELDRLEELNRLVADDYPTVSIKTKHIVEGAIRTYKLALLSEIGSVDEQDSGTTQVKRPTGGENPSSSVSSVPKAKEEENSPKCEQHRSNDKSSLAHTQKCAVCGRCDSNHLKDLAHIQKAFVYENPKRIGIIKRGHGKDGRLKCNDARCKICG